MTLSIIRNKLEMTHVSNVGTTITIRGWDEEGIVNVLL
jgi:hypothetical protein